VKHLTTGIVGELRRASQRVLADSRQQTVIQIKRESHDRNPEKRHTESRVDWAEVSRVGTPDGEGKMGVFVRDCNSNLYQLQQVTRAERCHSLSRKCPDDLRVARDVVVRLDGGRTA
jgi:hypothetical protein